MCAIALPEARFSHEAKRSPIDTSMIPLQRYRLVRTRTHTHTHTETQPHTETNKHRHTHTNTLTQT